MRIGNNALNAVCGMAEISGFVIKVKGKIRGYYVVICDRSEKYVSWHYFHS